MAAEYGYWGKADPAFAPPADYHVLPFHALDVAAVGSAYLGACPRLVRHFAAALSLPDELCRDWLVFWLALHDLGKFATSFQNQRPDLLSRLQHRDSPRAYRVRHDSLGAVLWNQLLRKQDPFGIRARGQSYGRRLQPWISGVTGHHGQPPRLDGIQFSEHFDERDELAAAAFVHDARELFLPKPRLVEILAMPPERLGDWTLSWWLAGIAVLADWLGSNTVFFPYCTETVPLDVYWQRVQAQAERAVRASGVLPQPSAPAQTVSMLFDWGRLPETREPTPLQHWAESVALPDTPQLLLLEDVTGAGKTEAALTLGNRLMAAGRADGIFIGLPTMATANAMYERVASVAPRLFARSSLPSLTLAHARRSLVPGFRSTVLPNINAEMDPRQSMDETAAARCAAWLADSNKKALLANVGVGTLDQGLLGILHARHQSLRLLGLFRKVLIVDEVHACDAYTQRLLEGLLRFHAAAGGNAILLSATLPQRMKQALVDAFSEGRGITAPTLQSEAYPLAALVSDSDVLEQALDTRPEVRRRVEVEYVSDSDEIHRRIVAALKTGRCVCWIRNTIADALSAWEALAPRLPSGSVTLFHARYAMADRLAIEAAVLERFGPDSNPAQRAGRLVISTQVVEQSLDVDFDLLVSDLAPIDRLIQRAGRLQRHVRDTRGRRCDGADQRGGATMVVHGPCWAEVPMAQWFKDQFRKAAYVYRHPGHLWLTARMLVERRGFAMPADARPLIEGVFGEPAQEMIPEALQKASAESEGQDWAATNLAAANQLDLPVGYRRTGHGEWAADGDAIPVAALDDWDGDAASTRIGEPTITIRLARFEGNVLRPWHDDTHAWEASSLRVPARMIAEPVLSATEAGAMERAKEALPDRGRWSILLPLQATSEACASAIVKDSGGRIRQWWYDSVRGLRAADKMAGA